MACFHHMVSHGQSTTWRSPSLSTSNTWPLVHFGTLPPEPPKQCRSISTELSPDTHRGRRPHPSQRSEDCSTITAEREVSWSQQHPSRTGQSRWRGCNHRSHDNLQQDLADWRKANPWTQSLVITLPKKGNPQQHQNYRTISLISHTSKVMLKIILKRLKPQAKKIIAKNRQASEQAGAPQSRSSTYKFCVRNISSTSTTSTMSS